MMPRVPANAGLVVVMALAGGCFETPSRDARLEYGSTDDVRAVLASGGMKLPRLTCTNVRHATGEVIRSVACATTLTAPALATLIRALPLRAGTAFNEGMRDACESRSGLRSGDPDVEVLVGMNTRVPNGVGRIEIHVVRASGAACVEITYPWSE